MPLTNLDLTDREMLHVVAGCQGPGGYATSEDVADALGLSPNGSSRSPAGQVSSRLSWMRRNGLLERLEPRRFGRLSKERLWMITPFGEEVMHGRLNKPVERAIADASAGASVLMMRELVRRAYVEASAELAAAVRREYLHNIARRPR